VEFEEVTKHEATITDDILTILKMEVNKDTYSKYFSDLLILLNKMEEKELFDFVKKEVYDKWNKEELLKTIKKLEKSKEKFRDLKLNILKSRKHITLKGENYWNTLPLIRYTEVSNKYWRKLGITRDAFYLKTIRSLKHEIDIFLSSQEGVSKKNPFDDILENIDIGDLYLLQLKEKYLKEAKEKDKRKAVPRTSKKRRKTKWYSKKERKELN